MSAPDLHTNPRPSPRDGADALSRLVHHAKHLMKSELNLAKAEMSRNAARAGVGLAMIAVAFMLALTATEVLAAAAVAALVALGLTPGWAALALGAAFLILALIFVMVGVRRLRPGALAPAQTMDNLSDDIDALKGDTHA